MPDWIAKPDVDFAAQMNTVVTAFEADEAAYGLVDADTLALRALVTAFNDDLAASDQAKAASNVAVAAKDASREALEVSIRPTVMQIQVNPAVTDESRTSAGLPIRDTVRTFSSPIAPIDLVARELSGGVVELRWSANGNSSGIQYRIEKRSGAATEFSLVDVTGATSFKDSSQPVGTECAYQVRARRGDATSAPSNTATVYA
jgi:hypothetical protein